MMKALRVAGLARLIWTPPSALSMKVLSAATLAGLLWMDVSLAAPDGFADEAIFEGEGFTVDVVFTPDEKLLTIQKMGYVNLYEDPNGDYSYSSKRRILDISGKICDNQERALGAIQLHPDFGVSNRYVYLYYTYNKYGNCNEDGDNGPVNVLSRWVLSESFEMTDEYVLFESPSLANAVHNGGKIEFGKDGYLYVPTGDMNVPDESQSLRSLLGSMIRLTDDGSIPPDNTFAQDPDGVRCNVTGRVPPGSGENAKCQELYAIGLRNPWRMAMNPNTEGDKVHYRVNDVQASNWEEINDGGDDYQSPTDAMGITNYGWPLREGPCRRGRDTDCDDYDGYQHPVHYFKHSSDGGAVTAGAFIPNGVWPAEYDNGYLYADFVGGAIYLLKDNANGEEDCLSCNPVTSNMDVSTFVEFQYVISMTFGPYRSGALALYYMSTDAAGTLRRVYFEDGVINKPPNAVISAATIAVEPGVAVEFSGARSTDPEGGDLTYEWDFDGDGVVDSLQETDSFAYSSTGIYDVKLTVQDDSFGQSTTSTKIVVGNPPTSGYPGVLFPWNSGPNLCPPDVDYCGILEFCQSDDLRTFGYRLPCVQEPCECVGLAAPLIRLTPGNVYRLTLRNAASEPTNLHTHGLHIIGDADGDDPTRVVSGGGNCLDYTWNIRSDHSGGTNWYHPHYHGSVQKQVEGGAVGMIIVEDNTNLNSVLPAWAANERLLQVVITADGLVGNGRKDDVIAVRASQWYRLRVSLVSADAVPRNFTFDDKGSCEVHKVATDGVWRSQIPGPKANVWELTGASRADFAVRCGTPQSLVPLYYGEEVASTIWVGPVATNPVAMEPWSPVRPYSLQDLSNLTIPEEHTLSVNLGYDHVNDIAWDPDVPMDVIAFDQVHEWTLLGTASHPFHLHLYHMQVMTEGGCGPHEEGEYYDTISAPDDCVVRFITADFGQRCVFHCHVLLHEDNGSMAWVNVTGIGMPRNNRQSFEYQCPADASSSSQFMMQVKAWDREPHPMAHYDTETYSVPQVSEHVTEQPPSDCKVTAILESGQTMMVDEPIESPQKDRYVVLQDNGNLVLMLGTPDNPVHVLWESGTEKEWDDYLTILQRDGNLVTWHGDPGDTIDSDIVWTSTSAGKAGTYFLGFNCDGISISIFKGLPEDIRKTVWTAPSEVPEIIENIEEKAAALATAGTLDSPSATPP